MALSLCASEHLAEEIRLGNVWELLRPGRIMARRANKNVDDQPN